MPKYAATTTTAAAAARAAHRTRRDRWRKGAGTGGDTVGDAGGEGEVGGAGDASVVMVISPVVSAAPGAAGWRPAARSTGGPCVGPVAGGRRPVPFSPPYD